MRIVGPCLEWAKYRNPKGYGQTKIGGRKGKVVLVHRWAWIQAHGDPGDLCVLHACDNPACYNVDHLFLGTRADNNRDMTTKGRHNNGGRSKTHCKNGHLLAGSNVRVNGRGARVCRTCHATYQRQWRQLCA